MYSAKAPGLSFTEDADRVSSMGAEEFRMNVEITSLEKPRNSRPFFDSFVRNPREIFTGADNDAGKICADNSTFLYCDRVVHIELVYRI
jgi:hypothetical protein